MTVRLGFLGVLLVGACNCEQETGGLEGSLGDAASRDVLRPDAIANACDLLDCDAGSFDAGSFDAGNISDASIGCNTPSECGPPLTRDDPWCGPNGHISGRWSCIAHACYWECDGNRICDAELPDCLACTDPNGTVERSCRQTLCMFAWSSARVAATNCTGEPALTPFVGGILNISPSEGVQCASHVGFQGGTQIVGMIRPLDDGRHLGNFPGLGGLCTGTNLFTGAERWHWSCAGCEMTWELMP